MSTADSVTHEKDFYPQLLVEIEAGNVNRAVEMVMTQQSQDLRMQTLSQLAGELDSALNIRGAGTLDLNRARALVRTRDRARELVATLDLDHALALQVAIDRAHALYLYLTSAAQINKTIMVCLKMMDTDNLSSVSISQIMRAPSAPPQSNRGRTIKIAVVGILILVGVVTFMVLQARSRTDSAATATALAEQHISAATEFPTPGQ